MNSQATLRMGMQGDAAVIAALSVQVFLDTYATDGVRVDLALEAFDQYSIERFAQRLGEPARKFILAERDAAVVGYAEVLCSDAPAPAGAFRGYELVRLYVQPQAQGGGVGRLLIEEVERVAIEGRVGAIWLTAWEGNADAMRFYRRAGYADAGATTYTFQGNTYGNRVYAKALPG